MERWRPSTELHRRRLRWPSFITTEVLIAIGLTIALAFLMSVVTLQYAAARRENDARRMLRLAAATELARIRAGGTDFAAADAYTPPATQPDGTQIAATTMPGERLWTGLTRVQVVAGRTVLGRRIEVTLVAYVAEGGNSP